MRWGSYGEPSCGAGPPAARHERSAPPLVPRGADRGAHLRGITMSAWNAMTYEGKDTIL